MKYCVASIVLGLLVALSTCASPTSAPAVRNSDSATPRATVTVAAPIVAFTPTNAASATPERATAFFENSYAAVSLDEMIAGADAIFIGEVTALSPTRWNQESGVFWQAQEAMPLHDIQVAVLQSLADNIGLGEQASITVLGPSPVDQGTTDEVQVVGSVAHDLRVGEQAIFFVVQRDMAWRGGTHTILRFMSDPATGYLTQGSDGLYHLASSAEPPFSLDALRDRIAER